MLVLGIHGFREMPYEDRIQSDYVGAASISDAGAALVEDGRILCAISEERLSRIKHSGKAPINAIRFCLDSRGIKLSDLDRIVFDIEEKTADTVILMQHAIYSRTRYTDAKDWLAKTLYNAFGEEVARDRICFVDHQLCQAAGAFYMSGFDECLVLSIHGGALNDVSGQVISARENSFNVLESYNNMNGLGQLYMTVMQFLGCEMHDENIIMSMAAYGDPGKFRKIFKKIHTLLPGGKYELNLHYCALLYDYIKPRKRGDVFSQKHLDLAAALQEGVETVILHILDHYTKSANHSRLCLAGEITNNCLLNSKILHSGLVDEVFIQPAGHVADKILGGALYISKILDPGVSITNTQHVFLGSALEESEKLNTILRDWDHFLAYQKEDDITAAAAKLLAGGNVIGWFQGRSEFGCNALGNRSILADPGKQENRKIINQDIKKKEEYLPFALSIQAEYLNEYFEVPQRKALYAYMNFLLRIRAEKKACLPAVTHADGSARIQALAEGDNQKYWKLIDEFRKLTGIPVLLNTSFNTTDEPVVDSEEDAITCFLNTQMHYLVIGDYLISKKSVQDQDYKAMVLKRPVQSELKRSIGYADYHNTRVTCRIRLLYGEKYSAEISERAFKVLEKCDGKKTLATLFEETQLESKEVKAVMQEILELWALRLIRLTPQHHE